MIKPGTRLGYTLGINRDRRYQDQPLPTGQEKFQTLVGDQGAVYAMGRQPQRESPGKGQRKAGDELDLYLRRVFGEAKFAPFPVSSENQTAEKSADSIEFSG